MFRKVQALKSLSLFLVVNTSTVAFGFALAYRWARPLTGAFQTASVARLPGSDKERDGLIGHVNQVRTETARLFNRSGKLSEGPRQLMELTSYDAVGNRVETTYYLVSGNTTSGKEEYEYDDKGNIRAMTLRGADDSILSKETYQYEFDAVGNWTKMTTSNVIFDGGKLTTQPAEVTYRRITYYYDKAIADTAERSQTQAGNSGGGTSSEAAPADDANSPRADEESRATFASLRGALEGWVASNNARDIERQLSFYSAKLYFYYRARNVSREFVGADKGRMYERAEFIDVRADAPEITLDRDGHTAIMRFRKQYAIKMGGTERYGEVLQELRWQREGDGWKIIGERDVRVLR
jgi:hypothetical protein